MRPIASLFRLCAAAAALALAGCASMGAGRDDSQWAATAPVLPEAAPVANGAIYHDAGNMELFADPRAHRVGDILTIVLQESTQASKKATTSTSKKDKTAIDAPTLLGQAATLNGLPASIGLNGNRGFAGDGSSSQSNQLSGQITVTVAQRLSNGNLVVRGEKWLTINQGQEMVRISGIVRPQDINPDNSVSSSRVADARIAYTGRGSLADANTQGWLSRFFNSKWMPF
ncbi:flagellar basal body L-ring protein FlgH [Dyella sp. KRB-257]|uniref:flagellar basal body L-ring protein FlgH n=1 Tax=Dyella sp. KRB-257 TaxID=3400915 RepID=UPI003BFECDB9